MIPIGYPIHSVSPGLTDDTVIIAGGGGASKTGIPNKIIVLKNENGKFTNTKEIEYDLAPSGTVSWCGKEKLLAAAIGSQIKLFDPKFNELGSYETNMQSMIVRSMAFSDDGKLLLVVDSDNVLHLIKVEGMTLIAKKDPKYKIGDGKYMTKEEADKILNEKEEPPKDETAPPVFKPKPKPLVNRAAFYQTEKELFIAIVNEENLSLLKADESLESVAQTEDTFSFEPRGICIDGERLIVTGVNAKIRQSAVVELKYHDEKLVISRIVHPTSGLITAVTSSDKTVAVGTADGDVLILNKVSLGRMRVRNHAHRGPVTSMAPCGGYIVTGSLDNMVSTVPNTPRKLQLLFLILICGMSILVLIFVLRGLRN